LLNAVVIITKVPSPLVALDDPTPPLRATQIWPGNELPNCLTLPQTSHLRKTRCGPLASPIPAPRTPPRTDWICTPKFVISVISSGTFGTSSAENMRNRLFYIEFEIKKGGFSGERFGISSVPDISHRDKQEKQFAIVNLHHYRMCSFSYC
jgi:hypothetical protein